MKPLFIAFVFALSSFWNFAQPSKVVNAYMYYQEDNLIQAKEEIDAAIDHDKTKNQAKTWYYRGLIYQQIYGNLIQDEEKNFGISKEDALKEAIASFRKALTFDTSRIDAKNLEYRYLICADLAFQLGVEQYNAQDYEQAATFFTECVDIKDSQGTTDSLAIYNSALSYENSRQFDKAIVYYQKCQTLNYQREISKKSIITLLIQVGDTDKAINMIQESLKTDSDPQIRLLLINAYLSKGYHTEALNELELAIDNDPENTQLYFMKGSLLDKLQSSEAATAYEKALEIDPNFSDALYNLGAHYYNLGVDEVNSADESDTTAGHENFEKAKVYLLRYKEISGSAMGVDQYLENIEGVLNNK